MSTRVPALLAFVWTVHAATSACDVLGEADAVKLVNAPLGAVEKSDTKPDATNGHDHITVCGYFPKGYDLAKAEGPPDAGVLVTLHTMPDAAAAKGYYEGIMSVLKENGETVKPVHGIGEAAYLHPVKMPGSAVQVTILTFLKGNVMAMVQVWKKAAAPPDDAARALPYTSQAGCDNNEAAAFLAAPLPEPLLHAGDFKAAFQNRLTEYFDMKRGRPPGSHTSGKIHPRLPRRHRRRAEWHRLASPWPRGGSDQHTVYRCPCAAGLDLPPSP